MENDNKIDRLDEIMRMIYLDQIGTMEADELQQELSKLQEGNKEIVASANKELMLKRLDMVMQQLSFGELIEAAMQKQQMAEAMLVEKTGLSSPVMEELRHDAVYPNNVPIQLLKNLAIALKLPYALVRAAVLKTFGLLRQQDALKDFMGYTPAFRKGHQSFNSGGLQKDHDGDGKELYENEEALNKYLNRLEELMSD